MVHQGRAGVPGRGGALGGDVVAPQARDRDGEDVGKADLGGEGAVVGGDLVEHHLVIVVRERR